MRLDNSPKFQNLLYASTLLPGSVYLLTSRGAVGFSLLGRCQAAAVGGPAVQACSWLGRTLTLRQLPHVGAQLMRHSHSHTLPHLVPLSFANGACFGSFLTLKCQLECLGLAFPVDCHWPIRLALFREIGFSQSSALLSRTLYWVWRPE